MQNVVKGRLLLVSVTLTYYFPVGKLSNLLDNLYWTT